MSPTGRIAVSRIAAGGFFGDPDFDFQARIALGLAAGGRG